MKDNGRVCLNTDQSKTSLYSVIQKSQKLEEPDSCAIFIEICSELADNQSNNLPPLSFYPKDILISDSGKVYMSPCNINLKLQQNNCSLIGSINYLAPETLKDDSVSEKSDIWSLGILLYEMLHGFIPFQSQTSKDLLRSILKRGYTISTQISNSAKQLISSLLSIDPEQRPSLKQVLKSQFIQNYSQAKLRQNFQVSHKSLGVGHIVDLVGHVALVRFHSTDEEFIESDLIKSCTIIDEYGKLIVENLPKPVNLSKSKEPEAKTIPSLPISCLKSDKKLKPALRSARSSRTSSPSVRFDLNIKILGINEVPKPVIAKINRPPKAPVVREESKKHLPRREVKRDFEGIHLDTIESPVCPPRRVSTPKSRFLEYFREKHTK